jgi:putative ABC transport system permease protein
MDEEMRAHVEMQAQANLEAGMGPEEARRAALRQFGWVESIKETCREQRGIVWLEHLAQDVRYAGRLLRKNPGFTAVVALTLALGIGASTAVFSVLDTVLFHPVPGPEPHRLVEIGERSHGNKDEPRFGGLTTPAVEVLKTKSEVFSDVVWYSSLWMERTTADFIDGFGGDAVSANFFALWNIKPLLGRTFGRDEAVRLNERGEPERDCVMVLSYALWQSRFGGDRGVLGRTFEASGRHFTVIGVMPPHFQFPAGAYPTFWVPAETPPPGDVELANNSVFARLRPGVTLAQAQAMLDMVARQLLQEFPAIYDNSWRRRGGGFALMTRPLANTFTQTPYGAKDLQQTLWGLLAAIGFVLLIVCVNVGNLMLARTEKRQHELAIRAAVGAGRGRLLRQLLTESLLLAGLGAAGGLAVTFSGMKILVSLIPQSMPRLRPIQVDGHALAATLIMALGAAVLFGLVPAWHASRASVSGALKQAGMGMTLSAGWRRYRGALVVAEVALSLLLLAGAGLMIESVIRMLNTNPGFDPEKLLFVHPGLLRGEKYYGSYEAANARAAALFEELHDRFAALPGVKAVGISKFEFFRLGYTLDGQDKPIGLLPAGTGVGQSDLFRAMRIPLLAGRYFEKTDIGDKVGTVIVNQTMSRLCWPGESALNKRFRAAGGRVYEVVGIVGDAAEVRGRFDDKVEPTFYRPYQENAHSGGFGPYLVIRTQGDPRGLIPAIRDTMKAVERSMTAPWFEVVRQTLYERTQAQRTYMLYLVIFAGVGLSLSALGIYGVLAYSVARRTREIGIRMALGAQRRQVMAMVMTEGGRLAAIGVAAGLVLALWMTRLLRSQLYEVSPTDPAVFAAVALLLFAVALLACLLPAIRATRVDPMSTLRSE